MCVLHTQLCTLVDGLAQLLEASVDEVRGSLQLSISAPLAAQLEAYAQDAELLCDKMRDTVYGEHALGALRKFIWNGKNGAKELEWVFRAHADDSEATHNGSAYRGFGGTRGGVPEGLRRWIDASHRSSCIRQSRVHFSGGGESLLGAERP